MIGSLAAVNLRFTLGVPTGPANSLTVAAAHEDCASYSAIGGTGTDAWCDTQCKAGHCPNHLCQCTGAEPTEARAYDSALRQNERGIKCRALKDEVTEEWCEANYESLPKFCTCYRADGDAPTWRSAETKPNAAREGAAAPAGLAPVDDAVPSSGRQNEFYESAAGSGAACACSAKCDTGAPANCSEALESCRPYVEQIEGVAVLEHNSHYRLSDITNALGLRYRYDSVTVLCEPRYRKTLLRDALVRSSFLDGVPLANLCGNEPPRSTACGQAVERAISERAEPKPGWANLQGASGESNLTLSTGGEKEAALASALSGKLHRGGCQKAPKSTLVVSVRMGDVLCDDPRVQKHATKIMSLVNEVKAYINRSVDVITHVRFSGVMHYGSNEIAGLYMRTKQCDFNNRHFVQTLLQAADFHGLPGVRLQSEVDADSDLCTFVYSPHVLLPSVADATSGFPLLVQKLRTAAQQPEAGRYAPNGVARGGRGAGAFAAKAAEVTTRKQPSISTPPSRGHGMRLSLVGA